MIEKKKKKKKKNYWNVVLTLGLKILKQSDSETDEFYPENG